MKALSIMQPWAWLIVNGRKDIENRDWRPTNPGLRFRGPVLIHAGKKFDRSFSTDGLPATAVGAPHDPPLGGIVGMAEIVDCVTESDSPWFFGPYGFVIRNAKPLPFMAWKGRLGFFDVPDCYLRGSTGVRDSDLERLLERARNHQMSDAELKQQVQSWVRGEMGMGSDTDEAAYRDKLRKGKE